MLKKYKELWKIIKPYIYHYAVALAIPLTVGVISAAVTRQSMDVYKTLNTPPLAPPPMLFPIVWTILFILMGISSAMVYLNRYLGQETVKKGLIYYGVSLGLNFLWSVVFFNLGSALLAFVILLGLLYTIIRTIIEYYKVSHIAAYLQIPYALWVIFAGYINLGIWILN